MSGSGAAVTNAPVYPADQAVDIPLRDGSTAHVSPVTAADREPLRAFLSSLSDRSLYLRGCGHLDIDWLCDWSLDVDYDDRYGLVVSAGRDARIVAHAAYVRVDDARAEIAFEVADDHQGMGIATVLLGQLAAVAARHGITEFVATTMSENRRMVEVFEDSGFDVEAVYDGAEIRFTLSTELSPSALTAYDQRHHRTAVESVRAFLEPSVVAVVGASRDPRSVGSVLLENLLSGDFTGQVHPVNPHARTLMGRRCWGSVLEIPERIDLAVVAVPAQQVAAVAGDCAVAGVRALLVLSSGFAEIGPAGRARQDELLRICRAGGIRLVGPNCLGIVNNSPSVRLNASFAERVPPPGRIAMMSQSGGIAIALAEVGARLAVGVSSFVSVGNKADISGNDLLEYWEDDPDTDLIALYLESFGNPRRFARVARRVGTHKPILAVKSGRTPAGSRAASSHTAALLSASDVSVDALFRQAGVVRSDTLGELLDTAALLATQPLPRGPRVAIVTNGGGPGIMCADDCQAAGLNVVELEQLGGELVARLPPNAAVGNPIDMTSAATASDYRATIELLAQRDACDAIITLFVPTLASSVEAVAREIDEAARNGAAGIPVAAVFVGREPTDDRQPAGAAGADRHRRGAAHYPLPEDAVRALRHAVEYVCWRERPVGSAFEPSLAARGAAARLIRNALAAGHDWLPVADTLSLLDHYAIPHVRSAVVGTAEEAVAFARTGGTAIVLKAIAPGLLHKSDIGAVRLDLHGEAEIRRAAAEIERSVDAHGLQLTGLLAQEMAPAGVELLIGVVGDPSFGPVVACAAGGTATELLGDVAVRITPVSDLDARDQLRSLRTFPLLDGYRGAVRCDVGAVERVLMAVSALVEHHPEIAELDLNPLFATPNGALVTDARIRVREAAADPPLEALRR